MGTRFLTGFVGFLLVTATSGVDENSSIQIHFTGKLYGNESFAQDGEVWYSLFSKEDEFELQPTTLTVTTFHDTCSDQPGEMTERQVQTDDPRTPLILIRGLNTLKPGKVKTAFISETRRGKFLYPGEHLYLRLAQTHGSTLQSLGTASQPGEVLFIENLWKLTRWKNHTPHSQIIEEFEPFDMEGNPSVVWAGDLDRDDQIDLLMDIDTRMYVTRWTLYLSSQAGPGQLVKKVAEYVQESC